MQITIEIHVGKNENLSMKLNLMKYQRHWDRHRHNEEFGDYVLNLEKKMFELIINLKNIEYLDSLKIELDVLECLNYLEKLNFVVQQVEVAHLFVEVKWIKVDVFDDYFRCINFSVVHRDSSFVQLLT